MAPTLPSRSSRSAEGHEAEQCEHRVAAVVSSKTDEFADAAHGSLEWLSEVECSPPAGAAPNERSSTMRPAAPESTLCALLAASISVCAGGTGKPAPPALETAVDAWIHARAWVDAMKVPDAPHALLVPASPQSRNGTVPAPAASADGDAPSLPHAVAAVLRLRGRVVGTGVASGAGAGLLNRAVSTAIDRARQDDAFVELSREDRERIGPDLALELEISSDARPIMGRTVAQVVARIEPALDALALRRGDRWTWTMPSVSQASNLAADPIRTCAVMLQQLAIDPRELPTQTLPDGTGFYVAPTRRLAQKSPRDAPFEVIRGHEIIPLTAIAANGRADFVAAMANHLRAHIVRPATQAPLETAALRALGMRGDYRPHIDHHRSLAAPPSDQALAALALASVPRFHANPDPRARASVEAAADLLAALAEVSDIEDPPLQSPAAVALALLADDAMAQSGFDVPARPPVFMEELRKALAARLATAAPNDHTRAIELAAAAVLAARGAGVVEEEHLSELLAEAWQAPGATALVGTLPWLLVAERARGSFNIPARVDRIRAAAEPVRRALLASQLGVGGPEEAAPDAAGGFALTGGVRPMATSQSARPTMALALMLAEPSLTSDEEVDDLLRAQLMAVRFLRQLAVDERSGYAFRDPARCTGGIRDSLWDSTQPVAATAMALLAVIESEVAFRAAAGRRQDRR